MWSIAYSVTETKSVSHFLSNGADFCEEGTGTFQVVRRTGLEVDLERMQNYCMELLALYLDEMIT